MNTSHAISRRRFLRASAAAAGACALPAIIPASVLGKTSPGNKVNVGVIGIGAMGRGHLNHCLSHADTQVVATCDVDRVRADHAREVTEKRCEEKSGKGSFSGCKVFGDFRELLAMPDLDAVTIGTPDHWHALIAVAACKAGKDVYCEKPLAHSVAEGRAIADAARKHGRVFQTGSQQRSDRTFRFAAELVRNGCIGRVKEAWISIGGPPKFFCDLPAETVPQTLDWDFWVGPSPMRPYHAILAPDGWDYPGFPQWRGYAEFGGGGQCDWGAHHYDIAQWGLGTDHTGPVEVIPPDDKDIKQLTCVYENGVRMMVGRSVDRAGALWVGEKGRVGVNRGGFLFCDPPSLAGIRFGPNDVRLYDSPNHFSNWIECIRSRKDPICTAEIGHRTATICNIGNIACRLGRPLRWDPKAERFVNDNEANRLLNPPMRPPWTL